MLALAEAIDIATGQGILTGYTREPLRVLYYNAEDDQDVLDARVSALLTHYQIEQADIVGNLYAVSGISHDDFLANRRRRWNNKRNPIRPARDIHHHQQNRRGHIRSAARSVAQSQKQTKYSEPSASASD